ncbi:hypothetical protein MTR67_040060 [Solanum verrucosum]|uniref:LOB domain-containing protein n=1 Tax=Solanum verrucosum TaxID=315347 RepID=A0AAF0UHY3_SOLVR|nr:hypothetical protein MTR67_040060 [Solanum verrucosum]
MLNSVDDNEKKAKMVETLISEAKIRYENPVYGCIAVEKELRLEIEETKKELDLVQKTKSFFKDLLGRSSMNKKNEEISTSGTQSFQGYKSNIPLEEATSITEHITIQDVKKTGLSRIINVSIFNQSTFRVCLESHFVIVIGVITRVVITNLVIVEGSLKTNGTCRRTRSIEAG